MYCFVVSKDILSLATLFSLIFRFELFHLLIPNNDGDCETTRDPKVHFKLTYEAVEVYFKLTNQNAPINIIYTHCYL